MTSVLCPVCINWARSGGEGTFDAPHHPRCPVPGAAVDLLAACKAAMVLLGGLGCSDELGDFYAAEVDRVDALIRSAVDKAERKS